MYDLTDFGFIQEYYTIKGTEIIANVYKMLFPNFQEFLNFAEEGLAVYIKKPTILQNQSGFWIVDNPLKIEFNINTQVEHCIEFVDVIGDLVMCGPVGKIIQVSLWNSFVDQMENFIANHVPGIRVIVILQFASLTYIRVHFNHKNSLLSGHPMVSNYFGVSKMFLNNDIEEIKEFCYKMEVQDLQDKFTKVLKHISTE
ncbi:hypothetical protein LXL04_020449 [Taraxacum kok-saghyz]